MQTVMLPMKSLAVDPRNLRFPNSPDNHDSLAESIVEQGLLLPLRVRASGDGYVIVSGHRRFAALLRNGVSEVPCILVGDTDAAEVLAQQLTENLQRENLSPMEEAEGFQRYMDSSGLSASQAAKKLQLDPSRISKALPLLGLSEPIRAAIQSGTIPKDTAYSLSRLPEGVERNALFARALAGTLTRDEARATKVRRPKSNAEKPCSRIACRLSNDRTVTVVAPALQFESLIETLEQLLREAKKARSKSLSFSTFARQFRDQAAGGES